MKALVTGGAGFIGARLVNALCAAGHEVRVLSRKGPATQEKEQALLEFAQGDLLDRDCPLQSLISGCSVVFSCAGELRDESRMAPLHVDATLRLIEACKRQARATGQPIHWVQLSSVGAYGPIRGNANAERVVTEETAPAPVGTYETTKTRADELVAAAGEEGVFSYSILRPSNVFGSGMPNDSLRQWGRMISKRLFFYVGAPGAVATYVHVEDVVSALLLCGFDERARGEVFNLSNDCSQERLVNGMAKALGLPRPNRRVPEWSMRMLVRMFSVVPGFPVSDSRIDALVARTRYPSSKLESLLGFRPQHEAGETIGEIFS